VAPHPFASTTGKTAPPGTPTPHPTTQLPASLPQDSTSSTKLYN